MIQIHLDSNKPYYEQVVLAIKEQCLYGILLPGDKIPSIREMAHNLMINPNTISKAYKELEYQNVIETVRGKGTFIKKQVANNAVDMLQIKKIRQEIEGLILEAMYLKVSEQTIHEWIEKIYQSIQRSEPRESRKPNEEH